MHKKTIHILFALLVILFLFSVASAESAQNATSEDNSDNSVQYIIDIGDGKGSVLIFGDNNTVHVPGQQEDNPLVPNKLTLSSDGKYLEMVLITSKYIDNEMTITFDKMVFRIPIQEAVKYLVWYEQEK